MQAEQHTPSFGEIWRHRSGKRYFVRCTIPMPHFGIVSVADRFVELDQPPFFEAKAAGKTNPQVGDPIVVYEPLYKCDHKAFYRPLSEWHEMAQGPGACRGMVPRFSFEGLDTSVELPGENSFAGTPPSGEPVMAPTGRRKLVYVASPLRAGNGRTQEQNLAFATECADYVKTWTQHVPFVPHLLFTQFLDATVKAEDDLAIEWNKEMLLRCDELWLFSPDGRLSSGMQAELDFWLKNRPAAPTPKIFRLGLTEIRREDLKP